MTDPATIELRKHAVGEAAAAAVEPGMLIGLGTGSTAAHLIRALGQRVAKGLAIRAVASSERSAALAAAAGIAMLDFADIAAVDLYIDGVDEIDPALRAIKGAGGAMLREKIVATAATRMIAIADGSKAVARLGTVAAVPIEVLPFARAFVAAEIGRLGGEPTLRTTGAGVAWRSDQGNLVLDCRFGPIADPAGLAAALGAVPGLLGHGLFLGQIDTLYLGGEGGVVVSDRPIHSSDGLSHS